MLDRFELLDEISDFFSYRDAALIKHGKSLFESSSEIEWKDMASADQNLYVENLLDQFDLGDLKIRHSAALKLFYISQGCSNSTTQSHIDSIIENNIILFKLGLFSQCYQGLRLVVQDFEKISKTHPTDNFLSADMELAIDQMVVLLCIVFLIIQVNIDREGFADDLVNECNEPFTVFLFNLVVKMSDGNRKHYPTKKVLFLLWKSLLATVGNNDQLFKTKNAARIFEKLPPITKSEFILKSKPTDYIDFCESISNRYPSYIFPDPISAFGSGIDSTLFAKQITSEFKKSSSLSLSDMTNFIQPFTDEHNNIPPPINEGERILRENMYISIEAVQFCKEFALKKADEEAPFKKNGKKSNIESRQVDEDTYIENEEHFEAGVDNLNRIDKLYSYFLPNLPAYLGMMVRLLYYVNLGNAQTQRNAVFPANIYTEKSAPEDELTTLEFKKHKELITRTITSILILLLKSISLSNVFCFEYLSQLLIDNNGAILILKIVSAWFQFTAPGKGEPKSANTPVEIPEWLKYCEEPPEMNFFSFTRESIEPTTNANHLPPLYNSRNIQTSINLLAILHKMTKRKPHRILSLVQWKSSAVLKRVLKLPHVDTAYYALKLLKSQIPYLGRKWKMGNMKIITMIYLGLKPGLVDDYLLVQGGSGSVNVEEALGEEQQLRALVKSYHARNYPSIFEGTESSPQPPKPQKVLNEVKEINVLLQNLNLTSNSHIASSEELDSHFLENYETWLHEEVWKYPGEEGEGNVVLFSATEAVEIENEKEDDAPEEGFGHDLMEDNFDLVLECS